SLVRDDELSSFGIPVSFSLRLHAWLTSSTWHLLDQELLETVCKRFYLPQDDPSVNSVHRSISSSSNSMGAAGELSSSRSTMKSAKICPLTDVLGLYCMSYSPSFMLYFYNLPAIFGFDSTCLIGWSVMTMIGCAWKLAFASSPFRSSELRSWLLWLLRDRLHTPLSYCQFVSGRLYRLSVDDAPLSVVEPSCPQVSKQICPAWVMEEELPTLIAPMEKEELILFFAAARESVLVEELHKKSINEKEVLAVVEEEGNIWMTPIYEYLTEEILLAKKEKARAIRHKSRRYAVINVVIYKKSYLGPWLRPAPKLSIQNDPSENNVHGFESSSSAFVVMAKGSSFGRFTIKSAKICPFTDVLGMYCILLGRSGDVPLAWVMEEGFASGPETIVHSSRIILLLRRLLDHVRQLSIID
nr:reverse transcriptase domain-containing protein [Tanacetum cinerariifolium]